MPPRPSTLISAFSAPSRLLYPSTRLISTAPEYGSTISRQPPRQPPRIDWDKTIESRKIFKEEFETRLQALRPQQPTSGIPGETQGAADGKDKMVEYLELVQTQYKFSQGDAYAPHDLSFQEQRKRRARKTPAFDAMDLLGINPIKEYRNFSMMSEYVTELGRIKHSRETGLRPVNQRRMAKAIRRAIGLGLMSAVHRHPEVMGNARPDRKYMPKTW